MSRLVNASQDEVFRLMMNYFALGNMKILTSNSPSYILAEFGSWISMSLGCSKGELEVNIVKRKSGSYVNLNFSFLKAYLISMLVATILAVLLYGFIGWIVSIQMSEIEFALRGDYLLFVTWFTILMTIIISAVLMGVFGYNVSLTRRRLMEELKRTSTISDMFGIERSESPNPQQ